MDYDCLIVDDEVELVNSTAEYFELFDVKTAVAFSAEEAYSFFEENSCKLLLLDINLGDSSGFEVCKRIRKLVDIPILFISARTAEQDQLLAFSVGGDDYIVKPYSLGVLLAKVRTMLKRIQKDLSSTDVFTSKDGSLVIDTKTCRVYRNGEELNLRAMEYKLLSYLYEHRGRVVPKEELFEEVWEETITGDGTLNVHIRHLREKIEKDPASPKFIHTTWGRGYRFEDRGL